MLSYYLIELICDNLNNSKDRFKLHLTCQHYYQNYRTNRICIYCYQKMDKWEKWEETKCEECDRHYHRKCMSRLFYYFGYHFQDQCLECHLNLPIRNYF